MNTLIRKFARTKWLVNADRKLNNFSADAITGCIRTNGETLSVWMTDSKSITSEHNKKIIAGLALGMTRPDTIDIIFFDRKQMIALGLELLETDGQTLVGTIKEFHNDIVNIDYQKLGIISEHIMSSLNTDDNALRIPKNKLIEIVIEYLGVEYNLDALPIRWQEAIIKKQNS